LLDEKKLQETSNLYADFESPEKAAKVLKLVNFEKFDDTTQALAAVTATVEGKISKPLKKLLKRLVNSDIQEKLLVADSALGKAIKEKFSFECTANSSVQDLMRVIRSQADSLLQIDEKELAAMRIGLAHR
ncbi:unnamed protein product, partial [Adineta steineri]